MTDIIILLDESGSMESMGPEPVQAMNAFIADHKGSDSHLSLYTFASSVRKIIERKLISTIPEYKDYRPNGMTKLFDCIKEAIESHKDVKNVILVIITDGDDTASQNCRAAQAKTLIKEQETNRGWQVVFIGANADAFTAADSLGIAGASTTPFAQKRAGDLSVVMRNLSQKIKDSPAKINLNE